MTGLLGLCFARCGGQGWGLGCTGQPCDAEPRLGHGLGPPRAAVVTMVLWCPQQNWDESAWGLSPGLCDAVRFRPSVSAAGGGKAGRGQGQGHKRQPPGWFLRLG